MSTRYTRESYKNTHGHVLIAAGSRGYSGAAALMRQRGDASGRGARDDRDARFGANVRREQRDAGSDHDGAGRNRSRRGQR